MEQGKNQLMEKTLLSIENKYFNEINRGNMKLKNLSNEEFLLKLNELEECGKAVKWVKEKGFDLKQTWNTYEQYYFLYWLANKMGVDHKAIVSSACQNAKLVMKFVKKEKKEIFKSIETVEKWCNGDTSITKEILKSVYDAIYDAAQAAYVPYFDAYAANDFDAASSAYAAFYAACAAASAASSSAFAAASDADAAYADSDAASDAADSFDSYYSSASSSSSASLDSLAVSVYVSAANSAFNAFNASNPASFTTSVSQSKRIQDQILINIRNLIDIAD